MDGSDNSSQAPLSGQIKEPFQWPHEGKDGEDGKKEERAEDKEEKDKEEKDQAPKETPKQSTSDSSSDSVIHYPYGENAKRNEAPPLSSSPKPASNTNQGSFQLLQDEDRKTIDTLKEHALKMVAEERAEIERQAEERKKQLDAVEQSLGDPRITEAFFYLSRAKDKVSGGK